MAEDKRVNNTGQGLQNVNVSENRRPHQIISEFLELLRANIRLVVAVIAVSIFLFLLSEVLQGELMRLDRIAISLFVMRLRTPWLTPIMEAFSALATPVVLLVLLLVVIAFAPGRAPGWCCTINLVLVVLLNQILKFIGHSMVAMAFFGLLAWFVWRYEKNRWMRNLLVIAFSIVILMIGISRVYLGVHYASDVLAGFCVSLVWLTLYTRLAVPVFLRDKPAISNDH